VSNGAAGASPGLVLGIGIIGLVLAGGAWAWFSYQQRSRGYEEGSICARELQNRSGWWTAFFLGTTSYDPKDPDGSTRKTAEAIMRAENANRDEFVAIVDRVDFAQRTGIAREVICLPDPQARGVAWPFEEFKRYDDTLKSRLKADGEVCRVSFEKDIIRHLSERYPCARA
jgi:hypothetical protein